MAEEKRRRQEFKEFQKKLKENREQLLLAKRGINPSEQSPSKDETPKAAAEDLDRSQI